MAHLVYLLLLLLKKDINDYVYMINVSKVWPTHTNAIFFINFLAPIFFIYLL